MDKRNNHTNIHTISEQWQPYVAAICIRRRHAESSLQASTQGRNASGSYTLMTTEVEQYEYE